MILGIDVSHYDLPIDWNEAKNNGGVGWMYAKATEGVASRDLTLRLHVNGAKVANVATGAYHFFHGGMAGGVQADFFLNVVAGLKLDLPPVLDWEMGSADGVSAQDQMMRAKAWLTTVEAELKVTPIIYGGESFLRDLSLTPDFARYPLWLAHYGVAESAVRVPSPWKAWMMWQYTGAETVPGVTVGHHVDASWLNGTVDSLRVRI